MPSPLAHATMGYVIYRVFRPRVVEPGPRRAPALDRVLLVSIGVSLLPDIDAAFGLAMGDFGRFHNNATHSLVVGVVVAAAVGGAIWWRQRTGFWRWFIIVLLSYELHVIMDFLTIGRGVMALWPFTTARFQSPVRLFYGLHWSQGWLSARHLWTLVTELGFVALALLGTYAYSSRKVRYQVSDSSS